MRSPTTVLALIAVTLVACSDKPQLTVQERAKYTAELISKDSQCRIYLQKLSPPVTDGRVIDEACRSAKAAHCLSPDV